MTSVLEEPLLLLQGLVITLISTPLRSVVLFEDDDDEADFFVVIFSKTYIYIYIYIYSI